MKKFPATQEMADIYPAWSRVRSDDQSTGYQMLNALAFHMDKMDKTLYTAGKNAFLTTANIDEVDILHRVDLPEDFDFAQDTSDPLVPFPIPPTVTGFEDMIAYPVSITETNDLEDFWYKAAPNRYTIDDVVSGVDHNLLTFNADDAPLDVNLEHHLLGGKIWVETVGGTEYLKVVDGQLTRARIILRGLTRKGTEESEVLVFPWDMKQAAKKEWRTITKIEVLDMEPEVVITIKSGDFDSQPYIDAYNLRYSNTRRKIDMFWGLGEVEGKPTLDMIQYQSDDWETLAIGLPGKHVVQSWELLDEDNNPVTGVDLAVQPFSERAWVSTADGKLYLYDLSEDMVSGVDHLVGKTHGSHVQFEYDTRYLIRGESFIFTPWHARPLKEIDSYRIWYRTPAGVKFGIFDGTSVPFSSNFTVRGRQLTRTIADEISIPLTELGEYLFVLEVTFIDGDQHTEKIIAKTNHKVPLAILDISPDVPTVSGLDFDSDQRLWVRDLAGDYYQIGFHYDLMLVDYDKKLIYFREDYDQVDVGVP